MKRLLLPLILAATLVSPCFAAAPPVTQPTLTPQQQLTAWLAKPVWNAAAQKLLTALPLAQAEQMWPAITKMSHAAMAHAARVLASKQLTYAAAVAYYNAKLATPAAATQPARWQAAQADVTQRLVLLYLYIVHKSVTDQAAINTDVMTITGGKAASPFLANMMPYLSGDTLKTLLLLYIDKYGDDNGYMSRNGGVWTVFINAMAQGLITKTQAIQIVETTRIKVMNKLTKTDPKDANYAPLTQYASQVATLYDQLSQ